MEDKTFRIFDNKPYTVIEKWVNLLKKQPKGLRLLVKSFGGPRDKLSDRLILGLHKNCLKILVKTHGTCDRPY